MNAGNVTGGACLKTFLEVYLIWQMQLKSPSVGGQN